MSDDYSLPAALASLDPDLVRRWTISDDVDRTVEIETASTPDLEYLVETVPVGVVSAIDDFLDQFGAQPPEGVVWLGDLAQASLEASTELTRRRSE